MPKIRLMQFSFAQNYSSDVNCRRKRLLRFTMGGLALPRRLRLRQRLAPGLNPVVLKQNEASVQKAVATALNQAAFSLAACGVPHVLRALLFMP